MATKSYATRQAEFVKLHGLKVGSTVKVIGKADSHEDGWDNTWVSPMDSKVGKTVKIRSINGARGIDIVGSYIFPYWVLKPVAEEKEVVKLNSQMTATIDKKNVVVKYGGSEIVIPISAVEKLMDAVEESRN